VSFVSFQVVITFIGPALLFSIIWFEWYHSFDNDRTLVPIL
jgi:hypothetical protein